MSFPHLLHLPHYHPSIFCLFALICGICTQISLSLSIHCILLLCFSFIFIGLILKQKSLFLLVTSAFFGGMLCLFYKQEIHNQSLEFDNQIYNLIGVILDKQEQKNSPTKEILTLQVHELHEQHSLTKKEVNVRCLVYLQQTCAHLTVGDTIHIPNIITNEVCYLYK